MLVLSSLPFAFRLFETGGKLGNVIADDLVLARSDLFENAVLDHGIAQDFGAVFYLFVTGHYRIPPLCCRQPAEWIAYRAGLDALEAQLRVSRPELVDWLPALRGAYRLGQSPKRRNMTRNDYYLIASRRSEHPERWSWEIRRRSTPLGIKMSADGFQIRSRREGRGQTGSR